ncbi:MAG: plasmid pRiA4b ORF-3 family protein [Gammaproteobacteria bacterium]|nr:plasmid pRiA4b ORF-3 family protein [Gammaproteobacteria bacterium]
MSEKNNTIIQVKISLLDSEPEIFRRVLVYDDTQLDVMHDVIQCAMGWDDYHLHQFIKNKVFYVADSEPDFGFGGMQKEKSESEHTIGELLSNVRGKMKYEYDFGDSWIHEIKREKLSEDLSALKHPVCIEGQYACPPEDCGGLWGYYNSLDILADPKHPEYEECLEWWGKDFDDKHFDPDAVNKRLRSIKYRAPLRVL